MLELNHFKNRDIIERDYESSKVKLVREILEKTGAKMVLYTKDRCCSQKIGEMMYSLVRKGLLDSDWYDTVPTGTDLQKDLSKWLISKRKSVNIDKYVILDAKENMQTPTDLKDVIWADSQLGLTREIANNIIEKLK